MANGAIGPNPNIYSTPPPVTPPTYYEKAPLPKQKSKAIKITVGVLVGIILASAVGATIALYTRVWDPLWNPFRPEPDKVIQEMTQRMKKVKTIHSETKINTEIKNDYGSADISMIFNSDADTTDPKNPKSAGDFNLAFSAKSGSPQDIPNEIKFSLGGKAKALGNVSYFKINPLSTMIVDSLRNQTGIDLNELVTNKWIKIDPESLSKSLDELLKNYFGTTMAPGIDGMLEKQTESQKEMQKKIEQMITGKKFFLVRSELPDTTVNGIKTYHYMLTLNKTEIKGMIPDFAIIYVDMLKEMMPPDYPLTEEDISQAKKELTQELNKVFDEFFGKVGDIDGEVWIGKKDYLPYGVKFDKTIDMSKIDKYSKGTITFNIDMNFSNFDKPVVIEAPKEYKTLEEIIKPILDQVIKAQAYQGIIERMDAISNTAEYLFYTSQDYRNIKCENTQYFKYSCDEIEKYISSKPTIRSSKKAYCAYVKIPAELSIMPPDQITYYCVDGVGTKNISTFSPNKINYCDGITFKCPVTFQ